MGLLTLSGGKVLECFYDEIKLSSPNYIVRLNSKYGLLSVAGEWILPPIYDNFNSVSGLNYGNPKLSPTIPE